jgi:hypothetical protein
VQFCPAAAAVAAGAVVAGAVVAATGEGDGLGVAGGLCTVVRTGTGACVATAFALAEANDTGDATPVADDAARHPVSADIMIRKPKSSQLLLNILIDTPHSLMQPNRGMTRSLAWRVTRDGLLQHPQQKLSPSFI